MGRNVYVILLNEGSYKIIKYSRISQHCKNNVTNMLMPQYGHNQVGKAGGCFLLYFVNCSSLYRYSLFLQARRKLFPFPTTPFLKTTLGLEGSGIKENWLDLAHFSKDWDRDSLPRTGCTREVYNSGACQNEPVLAREWENQDRRLCCLDLMCPSHALCESACSSAFLGGWGPAVGQPHLHKP